MPVGVLTDCSSVLVGALLGCFIGERLPEKLKTDLNTLLGFCAMSIGVTSIMKVNALAPVIASVLLGYIIGAAIDLEGKLQRGLCLLLQHLPIPKAEHFEMDRFVTVMVLFCFSGVGIYATFVEAMSGDSSYLLSKAVLDCITAVVFAVTLRYAMAIVPMFMLPILLLMFQLGKLIGPCINDGMLQDFIACGGVFAMVAGMRVAGIKNTAITNLIPAFLLVMPLSLLWSLLFR